MAASAAVASTVALDAAEGAARTGKPGDARKILELRLYHMRLGPKSQLFDDYCAKALLPALKRLGIGPVGVFTVVTGPDAPTTTLLIPYDSLDQVAEVRDRLDADADYARAGAAFLDAQASDPAYVRIESSLFRGLAGCPAPVVPPVSDPAARVYELRVYENHSEAANRHKQRMFDEAEIGLFRRHGLDPVFFGDALTGTRLPNVTYMLTFADMAAREQNWAAFRVDPDWAKLSTTPGYTAAELVSGMTTMFLRRAVYSEI